MKWPRSVKWMKRLGARLADWIDGRYKGGGALRLIPIPVYGVSEPNKPGFFIEPHYRPLFSLDGNDARMREYGILIKFTTLKFGSWKEPRRAEPSPERQ